MNSSTKKETRLFNLMKNLRDRKKKKRKRKRKKKNLLSFQGPSPLVCHITSSSAAAAYCIKFILSLLYVDVSSTMATAKKDTLMI
jgi:hypothetical protein